jgi:APA family basic amino acid/polyamine antiporter
MVHYPDIDTKVAFASAFASIGLNIVALVIAVGAILGILTVMFTFMLGATRVSYSMSRDGLLPPWFGKTHPERRVPARATWVIGIASALIAGLLNINEAAQLTNIGILLAFVVVCASVIVLRYRRPDLAREFRCPWMPVVPLVGIVFSIWLTTYLVWQTWVRFVGWFVIGLLVYLFYGRKRSRLAPAQPESPQTTRQA